MGTNPFTDGYENDVDFDTNESSGKDRDAWFRGSKGGKYRASFIYFHPVSNVAVLKALRANPKLSQAECQAIAQKALEERAASLSPAKSVSELTDVEKLDRSLSKFKKWRASYQEGMAFVHNRLGLDGPEADKVWRLLPEPKDYYTTVIILYPTNAKGEVQKSESFKEDCQVRPWRMSSPTYEEFDGVHKTLMLNGISSATQDFILSCEDAQYQKFKVNAAGRSIWTQNETFSVKVLTEAMGWYTKLDPFRTLSTEQLRQKLGMDAGPAPAGRLPAAGGTPSNGAGSSSALPQSDDYTDVLASV